jgi:glycosyltransferase involved in cell wall biosynthesis
MKVAFYVSPADTVPPQSGAIAAPWSLAADLINQLKDKVSLTLYTAKGSTVDVPQVNLNLPADFLQKEGLSLRRYEELSTFSDQHLAAELFAHASEYDVIHIFQGALRVLPFVRFTNKPIIVTVHDPFVPYRQNMFAAYANLSNTTLVTLSNFHKQAAPSGYKVESVYNGIDIDKFPIGGGEGGYLLMTGRIRREKGFTEGIKAAKAANIPLVIAGQKYLDSELMKNYWNNEIQPEINGSQVRYDGVVIGQPLADLYAKARALLMPIQWDEPFGLVMTEAMASGTPVIAFNRGSVSEIVKDGVTGFIIENEGPAQSSNWIIKKFGIEGMVEAIGRIGEIDRAACRQHVAENFTINKMAENYLKVYNSISG